jgi:hypothetical protein
VDDEKLPRLYWNPQAIAKLMRRNNIADRKGLAQTIGQPYTTVCENLTTAWSGRVKTIAVLVCMCRTFDVKLATLVDDPRRAA